MALAVDHSMPRRRGRPKGSGIDDGARLADVRAKLAADPSLTPTAAIRASGVDDPSAIRRLRDKLSANVVALSPKSVRAKQPSSQPASKVDPVRREPDPLPPDPPTAEARKREAELLAAYLEALAKTAPAAAAPAKEAGRESVPPTREPEPRATAPQPPPASAPPPNPFAAMMPGFAGFNMPGFGASPMGGMPGFPGLPQMPGLPPGSPFAAMMPPGMMGPGLGPGLGAGMSIPGLPSFLQPFQAKAAPPAPGTSAARQLEAFKLAIEAMTAIARFQLHLMENAAAYSPMALMLQGQTFIGQMMIASLTGQMNALNRPGGTTS